MATQTVEFRAATGLTLTVRLFAVGSDTIVQTASSCTEATNRKGTYAAVFTDPGAAEFELVAFSSGIPVCRWFCELTLTTATFQAYEVRAAGVVSTVTLAQAFPANFASLGINASGHVSRVTLVDTVTNRVTANTDQWGGVAVTGMPLPTASYTAPDNATIGTISINLGTVNDNVLTRLAASAYTAPLSASQTRAALGLASANLDTQLADLPTVSEFEARTLTTANYATAANQTAIKAVTDKLNTGLVQDGAVYQFTVNMLENAPGGGGGGSATLENQELILANLDNVTGAVAAAVARLQLETQITGFPATICRGSDYDTTLESEIRLQLLDLDNNPITEIGGTPVAEITWLFGLGTERQPRLVAGACSWDGTTDELVIQLAAADTNTTPLGSVVWQIGAQIGELTRWLGGGTTRIVERQFTA